MSDEFSDLVTGAQGFLARLSDNNTRDWFTAHKADYEANLKHPALALLDVFAGVLQAKTGQPIEAKLFRPHRDVRFSKDKTPYHTHLHMLWTLGGKLGTGPAVFFGIAPDSVTMGGGLMAFDRDQLDHWRASVSGPTGAALMTALGGLQAQGLRLDAPELKRVPAPHDATHPQADLLRRKSLTLWRDLDEAQSTAPLTELATTFDLLHPVLAQLQVVLKT